MLRADRRNENAMADNVMPINRSAPQRAPEWAILVKDFADGTYNFGLTWDGLVELEKARESGPLQIMMRLVDGSWHMKDVRDVIRLALVGAGTPPPKAVQLARDYVERRPAMESVPLAYEIMT